MTENFRITNDRRYWEIKKIGISENREIEGSSRIDQMLNVSETHG